MSGLRHIARAVLLIITSFGAAGFVDELISPEHHVALGAWFIAVSAVCFYYSILNVAKAYEHEEEQEFAARMRRRGE